MIRHLWLCSLLCVLSAPSPFLSSQAFAQDDEEIVDFDEATLNEDDIEDDMEKEDSGTKTSKVETTEEEEDDFEAEFDDEEPVPKKEDVKAEAKAEELDELEPVPEGTPEPEAEPEVAQPEQTPEPVEQVETTPEPTPEPVVDEPAPQMAQNNDPDLEYEARLYDIYVNYTSAKTPEDQWRGLVGQRQDERYKIQRNDNLWDISQTLFGDGNYWPKIWSLNSSITNPHIIEPGNTIRFLLGDESGPPAFTVSENEAENVTEGPMATIAKQTRVDDEAVSDSPEIPPPSRTYRPLIKNLPPSLPNWQDPDEIARQFDDAGISYGRRKIADIADAIPLAAYVTGNPPQALGQVTEIETGFNLAAALQYIYVRMMPGQGEVGDTFLSVFDKGLLKPDPSIILKKHQAFSMEVLGEIQLIEKVKSEKKEKEGDVYRALVTKTVSPVQVGSSLVLGKIEDVNLSEKGRKSQIAAQIIGGQFAQDRKLYGPQSFAFLDKGERDGIEVGQILPIRANRKARNKESRVLANIRSIGWLKVVKTTDNFATAVVLRSWDEIVTGDYTGAGEGMDLTRDMTAPEADGGNTSVSEALGDDGSTAEAANDGDAEEGIDPDDFSDDFEEE